jgi:flavin-dependent dehydrogenase
MTAVTDVLIAGAGPAGCATAIICARRGLEVLLLDRARFPRDKACGEGLLPAGVGALARLGLLATVRRSAVPIDGVGFSIDDDDDDDGDAVVAEAAFPDEVPPAYGLGVRRREFDRTLLDAARAQPTVTVLEGTSAHSPLVADGQVVGLRTDVGPIRARAVVIADGLRSRLRTELGLWRQPPVGEAERMGLRVHLRVPELPFGPRVRVLVGPELEHYLTPVGRDQLQVAVLGPRAAFAAAGLSATTFVDRLRAHRRLGPIVAAGEPLDRPLGAGPLRQRVRRVVTDGALLVGDAAGYVDAITGEGIGAALRQGIAAADTLATALAGSPRRAQGSVSAAALDSYARAHAAIVRDGDRLTEVVLLLVRRRWLARRALTALARRPRLLQQLLRVHAGAPLSSVPWSAWARLVAG